MEVDKKILTEIREYCSLNNIKDVRGFVNKCIVDGFNIMKYGVSPFAVKKPIEVEIKPQESVSTPEPTTTKAEVKEAPEDKINDVPEVPVKKPRRVKVIKK